MDVVVSFSNAGQSMTLNRPPSREALPESSLVIPEVSFEQRKQRDSREPIPGGSFTIPESSYDEKKTHTVRIAELISLPLKIVHLQVCEKFYRKVMHSFCNKCGGLRWHFFNLDTIPHRSCICEMFNSHVVCCEDGKNRRIMDINPLSKYFFNTRFSALPTRRLPVKTVNSQLFYSYKS